jgi:hypothetical protein
MSKLIRVASNGDGDLLSAGGGYQRRASWRSPERIIPVWNGVYHEMTGKACNSDEDRVRREETRDRSADNCMRAENQSCGPAFGTSARVMVNDTPSC